MKLKDQIKEKAARAGVYVSKASKARSVFDTFEMLKPVEIGMELRRYGSAHDGGYLIPDDLDGIEYCFSPGVGDNCSFEVELSRAGIDCFLCDASVDGSEAKKHGLDFEPKFVSAFVSDQSITLDQWHAEKIGHSGGEGVLQMDIEGSEYASLLAMSEVLQKQFRVMVIEFHFMKRILDPFGREIMNDCFSKLLNTHLVVHAHANNCCGSFSFKGETFPNVIELSFLRKDRVATWSPKNELRHSLDEKNVPEKRNVSLPSVWYQKEST